MSTGKGWVSSGQGGRVLEYDLNGGSLKPLRSALKLLFSFRGSMSFYCPAIEQNMTNPQTRNYIGGLKAMPTPPKQILVPQPNTKNVGGQWPFEVVYIRPGSDLGLSKVCRINGLLVYLDSPQSHPNVLVDRKPSWG